MKNILFILIVLFANSILAQWKQFTTFNTPIYDNFINKIAFAPNGTMWVATSLSVVTYKNGVWNNIEEFSNKGARDIVFDKNGNPWIASYPELKHFNGKKWISWDLNPSTTTMSLIFDNKGKLWVGTTKGILKYFKDNFIPSNIQFPDSTGVGNQVNDLFKDKDGNIWISAHSGLGKMDINENVKWYTKNDGFSNEIIYQTTQDKNGTMWASVFPDPKGNLYFLKNEKWHRISGMDPILSTNDYNNNNDYVNHKVINSKLGVIMATQFNGGIAFLKNNKWKGYLIPIKNPSNGVSCLVEDPNVSPSGTDIWVGTWHYGLFRFRMNDNKIDTVPLTNIFQRKKTEISQKMDFDTESKKTQPKFKLTIELIDKNDQDSVSIYIQEQLLPWFINQKITKTPFEIPITINDYINTVISINASSNKPLSKEYLFKLYENDKVIKEVKFKLDKDNYLVFNLLPKKIRIPRVDEGINRNRGKMFED